MAKSRSGGGITGKNVTQKPVRYGDRARAMSPKGVSQIGSQRGNHATNRAGLLKRDVERTQGELKPAGGPGGVMLGNEVAKNVGKGGPGAGRVVMRSGSQQGLAPARAIPVGRNTLEEFGPTIPGRK